jgi:hypothetical protein
MMRVGYKVMMGVCGASSIITTKYIGDGINTMLPWLVAMTAVVLADLAAGCRKSIKLGVHVSTTTAFRETMGKLVVYWSFVLMVASIEVATGHKYSIAMWGCLFVSALEALSVVGNILKPLGIDFSLKTIIGVALQRGIGLSKQQADSVAKAEAIEKIKKMEEKKWNQRKSK